MSERFYVNLPLTTGPFLLDGPEARHLATVCRLRPGDEVCLFNGDGHEYPARITVAKKREVELEILRIDAPQRELPFSLEVAAPLPKGDRGQFLIEKLTELGVAQFVPLITQRSVVHPKREKLERYVIEASKQCGRNVLMCIDELTPWAEYMARGSPGEIRMMAHPGGGMASWKGGAARLAVGPEGGFTDEEVALALTHSWQLIRLGPRILRIETAAIALASLAAAGCAAGA